MNRSVRTLIAVIAALTVSGLALAGDAVEVRQKDGSRWRGEVDDVVEVTFDQRGVEVPFTGRLVKAEELYIVVEGAVAGAAVRKTIFRGDIVRMRSADDAGDGESAGTDKPVASAKASKPDPKFDPNAKGVFVLPLTGMVGVEFRHEEMEAIAAEADKLGPGQIIVFHIESGGGLVTEMEQIHITLTEIKKRHRLVAWIKEAISGACATAIHCDEIYFMTSGTAGSMTAFAGGVAWSGKELERWLAEASDWMEVGGREPQIARCMIHNQFELSYDKDEDTGAVTFYPDLSGQHVLSRKGQNLTFTVSNAVHSGFADGHADTEEELAALLDLPKWNELSQAGRDMHAQWVKLCERAQKEIPLLAARLQYKGIGGGEVSYLQQQLSIVKELIRWWDRCPNVCALSIPPKKDLERWRDDIQRALARAR